jgi:hypothetical protein
MHERTSRIVLIAYEGHPAADMPAPCILTKHESRLDVGMGPAVRSKLFPF